MVETALAVRIDLRSGTWRGWTGEANENLPIDEAVNTGGVSVDPTLVSAGLSSTSDGLAVTRFRGATYVVTTFHTASHRGTPASEVFNLTRIADDGTFTRLGRVLDQTHSSDDEVNVFSHDGRLYIADGVFGGAGYQITELTGQAAPDAGPAISATGVEVSGLSFQSDYPRIDGDTDVESLGDGLYFFTDGTMGMNVYRGDLSSSNTSMTLELIGTLPLGRRPPRGVAAIPGTTNMFGLLSASDTGYDYGTVTVTATNATYERVSQVTGSVPIDFNFTTPGDALFWRGLSGYNRARVPVTTTGGTSRYDAGAGLVSIDLPSTDIDGPGSFRVSVAVPESEKRRWIDAQGPVAMVVRQLIRASASDPWAVMPHEWHGVLGEGAYNDGLFTATATPESGTPRRQMKPVRWNHDAQNRRTDGVDTSLAFQRATAVPIRMPSRIARPR